MAKSSGSERKPVQLTLVSTPYTSKLLRTVSHVRSIAAGRTVSMSEVFRDVLMAAAPALEKEISEALGEDKLAPLREARQTEEDAAC